VWPRARHRLWDRIRALQRECTLERKCSFLIERISCWAICTTITGSQLRHLYCKYFLCIYITSWRKYSHIILENLCKFKHPIGCRQIAFDLSQHSYYFFFAKY
jgi:hypothetical protein